MGIPSCPGSESKDGLHVETDHLLRKCQDGRDMDGVSALEGGKVAVLDDKRIVVFSKSGEEHEFVPQGLNTATGLCVDGEGALVTINRYRSEFSLWGPLN